MTQEELTEALDEIVRRATEGGVLADDEIINSLYKAIDNVTGGMYHND